MSEHIDEMDAPDCEVSAMTLGRYLDQHGAHQPGAEHWDKHSILIGDPEGNGGFAVHGSKTELREWVAKLAREVYAHLQRPASASVPPSGDREKVLRRVEMSQEDGVVIDDEVARVIASWWHGGQATRAYSFVSTGAVAEPDDLIAELAVSQRQATDPSDAEDDVMLLRELGKYIRHYGPRPAKPFWSEIWV